MARQRRHALEMVLRYEQGSALFGVSCDHCGLATVVPLEQEPKTDFAWQLVKNEVERRFDDVLCEPPQVEIARGPTGSERRAVKRERREAQRMQAAHEYWDRTAAHEAGRRPHPDDKIQV